MDRRLALALAVILTVLVIGAAVGAGVLYSRSTDGGVVADARTSALDARLTELAARLEALEAARPSPGGNLAAEQRLGVRLDGLAQRLAALQLQRPDQAPTRQPPADGATGAPAMDGAGGSAAPSPEEAPLSPALRAAVERVLAEREAKAQEAKRATARARVAAQWRARNADQLATLEKRLKLDAGQSEQVGRILERTLENFTALRDAGMAAQARGESFDWSVMGVERQRYLDEIREQLDATQLEEFEKLLKEEEQQATEKEREGALSGRGWSGERSGPNPNDG